jgi:hypothetical protein
MAKYLQVSYYSLIGVKTLIDLGDFIYGEWIVYEDGKPKYHINLHTENPSDILINSLLNTKKETIETILNKINRIQRVNLSLKGLSLFNVVKEEKLIELDLGPLPNHWIKNIT